MHRKTIVLVVRLLLIGSTVGTEIILPDDEKVWNDEDEKTYLEQAGCKDNVAEGQLLEIGACTMYGYRKHVAPKKADTKVFTTINYQNIRTANDKDKTLSIDLSVTMEWMDDRIKANISSEDQKYEEIEISAGKANAIWKPDFYVYNISDYSSFSESLLLKSLKIVSRNQSNEESLKVNVEYKLEAKAVIYCNFTFDDYPMDYSNCKFIFGDKSSNVLFVLNDDYKGSSYRENQLHAAGFDVHITIARNGMEKNIEIDICMSREIGPFILKYYLPCSTIVILSQISFTIPLNAIPGRVGLIVTQFLTLTSILIYQMVSCKVFNII